jgi:hypothetical protein
MIWPIVALLIFAFVAYKLTELMSQEAKTRRRRWKNHRRLASKGRTSVKFS